MDQASAAQTTESSTAFQLAPADARAVDLLLDGTKVAAGEDAERVQVAGKVFELLDTLPTPTPGEDLARRTAELVAESGTSNVAAAAMSATVAKPAGSVGRTFANSPDAPEGA